MEIRLFTKNKVYIMIGICANYWCSASVHEEEVFRTDITLGGRVSERQLKKVTLWLCARCAREMTFHGEVAANSATVRPSALEPAQVLGGPSPTVLCAACALLSSSVGSNSR